MSNLSKTDKVSAIKEKENEHNNIKEQCIAPMSNIKLREWLNSQEFDKQKEDEDNLTGKDNEIQPFVISISKHRKRTAKRNKIKVFQRETQNNKNEERRIVHQIVSYIKPDIKI